MTFAFLLRHIVISALAASLLAMPCAAQSATQIDAPAKTKPRPKKPAAKADTPTAMSRTEIVFYLRPVPMQELLGRDAPSWMIHTVDLIIDEKKAGSIRTFQSLAVPMSPGRHYVDYNHFSILGAILNTKGTQIVVEQGKRTYVEIMVENNAFFFTAKPEPEAKVMMARLSQYGGSR
ncbi:MAG: hypothetical protein ACLPX9_08470 [Rhodomicrobium sp.]